MASSKIKQLPPTVFPEKCSDKNLVGSVVEFFHDYIPSTSNQPRSPVDDEKVLWVKFEDCDLNDADNVNLDGCKPLIIFFGTTAGLQLWSVETSGEATLLYSQRNNYVHCAKLLPSPRTDSSTADSYGSRRPIIAFCEPGREVASTVRFFSLRANEDVKYLRLSSTVCQINANKRFILVARKDCLTILSSSDLNEKYTISNCLPPVDGLSIPVALGARWLAFADSKRVHQHRSEGGDCSNDSTQPIATTVMNAKKRIWGSLSAIGSSVASSTGLVKGSLENVSARSRGDVITQVDTQPEEEDGGVVTVVDLETLGVAYADSLLKCGDLEDDSMAILDVHCFTRSGAIVAHFLAHRWARVSALHFDPSGLLLLTACTQGHTFNLFRIAAHPYDSRQAAIHHLYTLERGTTPCTVVHMTISLDSRWAAVSTNHGSTHLFPITPYGGPVTMRTHAQPRVVNRTSRWQKSAGIDEIDLLRPLPSRSETGAGGLPVTWATDSSGAAREVQFAEDGCQPPQINRAYNTTNPRLPPYPQPCSIQPALKLNQQLLSLPVSTWTPPDNTASKTTPTRKARQSTEKNGPTKGVHYDLPLVGRFATSRCLIPGDRGSLTRDMKKKAVDSIFVVNSEFQLIEYELEVVPLERPQKGQKVLEDAPITLETTKPLGQWPLRAAPTCEFLPPFPFNHPLLTTDSTDTGLTRHDSTKIISVTPPGGGFLGGMGDVSSCSRFSSRDSLHESHEPEAWVSQVEINTHLGPHRRLWMGPQFQFLLYQDSGASYVVESLDSSAPVFMHSIPAFPSPQLGEEMEEEEETEGISRATLHTGADLPRTRPLAMPARRGHQRTRHLSASGVHGEYGEAGRFYIEAGSYQDSYSSHSSLPTEEGSGPGGEDIATNMAEAMRDDSLSGGSLRPRNSFISPDDFPYEEGASPGSTGSSPAVLRGRRVDSFSEAGFQF